MRIAKQDIPTRIDAPGAVARAQTDFGRVNGYDLFYWPPGHTIKVGADAEVILFSPQHEHGEVIDHLHRQLAGWPVWARANVLRTPGPAS